MRVPQFLLFTLGLSAMMALFGCSRESSVKENVNLKNNHSRVFVFNEPIPDPQAFADSMANTAVMEADTIPDTLTVTINDTVYMIGLLPYNVDKIYRFQWTLTDKNGKDTTIIGGNAKPQSWAYTKPGLYEPKFVAFDGNNATDTSGTATRKAWIRVIDTKPRLTVPKDTLWTRHDGDITFPILASDSFGTIVSIKVDLDASGKDSAKVWNYETFEDNDSLYLTVKNSEAKIDSLGNQKIYVIVTDDDGNETKDSVILHFNRIPRLKIIYPQDGARHNINDRFYFYYQGEDDDNPQNLQYFIYAQASKNGQPPQKAFTSDDLIASEFTSNIFEPINQQGKNVITLISDPSKQLTGRIYWDMYVTDGYDIVRMERISTGEGSSRPWNFYIGDLSSAQGTFSGTAKYQARSNHAGIHVEFSNGNKTFDAYTDEKGNYSVKVDAGLFTATASSDSAKEYKSATLKDLFIESGNTIMADEMVLKDTVAPVLLVKNIDTLTSREYNFAIYARDLGSFLDTVTAAIDGKAQTLNCSKDDDNAVFNCPLALSGLMDGEHQFNYSAKDKAGNTTTLPTQTIVVKATSMTLNVNGAQNARIGTDGKFDFTAKVIGAFPAADSVIWTWDVGNGTTTKKTKVLDDGSTTYSLDYNEVSSAKPGEDYIMTAEYKSNGANVKTQVKFGILGDDPAVIFMEPAFDDTVSLNDPVHFKVEAYLGKASNELQIEWACSGSASACPAKDVKEADISFNAVGLHTITVTVKDQDDKSSSATTTVTVVNDPPSINASTESNSNEYKINSIVTVKASASDKFGTINTIKWGCSNGMVVFDHDTTFSVPQKSVNDVPLKLQLPGSETSNYRCVFKAIDDDGEEGLDTLLFTTLLDLPTIRLSTKRDTVKINSTQTLKATATDKLGYIAAYDSACSDNLAELKNPSWGPMNGPEAVVRMPSTATDHYYCVVQVTDDDGNTARDTATYKVIVGLPTVTAYVNYNRVTIKDVVELNAHAQDSLGSLVKYEWGCGAASAQNIGFTFISSTTAKANMTMPAVPQNGYKCIVRVTDDDGNIAKDTVEIDIILAPPTIKVASEKLTVREGYNIALNATASDNNGLPSDPGAIAKREWSCGTPEQIASNWKSVSDFDTVWKAPAAQNTFYCIARVTDNDGNTAIDTTTISFSSEVPLIWVKDEVIYLNPGDNFELDASVNDVWQGIDWFTWECKEKATGKTMESKVTKYDYAANHQSFKIGKDSTYSEKEKDMVCVISAQETSTKVTFSDSTEVRLMQYHPVGVITAADTVYLWSGDESVEDEALYFYTPEWGGTKSKLGDLGDKNMQDFRWKFSNVDNNFYQGNKDGSLDTSIAEFNTAFMRSTTEGSMTITLDYRDSSATTVSPGFLSRHRAAEVSRKVYFSRAWKNQGKDTVLATSTMNTPPALAIFNDKPIIAYLENKTTVAAKRFDGTNWNKIGESITLTDSVTQLSVTVHGNAFYLAVLEKTGKLSVYKSAGATSSFAKLGGTFEKINAVKIVAKESDSNPHVVFIASDDLKLYMYDYDGSDWTKNTKFGTSDGTLQFREVEAVYNPAGEFIVLGVTTDYVAYYGYYKTDYTRIKWNGFSAKNVNQARLIAMKDTIYLGYLSRDVNSYGPHIGKGTFGTKEITWIKTGEGNNRVFASTPINEGILAYHLSLAVYNGVIYAAMDDKGKPELSQVHVYRFENNKWHLHGENQLPYFKAVFNEKKGYYLRGSSPMLAVDNSGKVYVSMLARENAGGANRNNGPLVMKYVADNWEIK